jgi:hypothetical protein
MARRLALLFALAALTTVMAACGPTIVSSEILSSLDDPPARVELRRVQPDPLDDWSTQEMWGVNSGDEAVCAGVRAGGLSWVSYLLAPRSERRLVGLGNGSISGQTTIVALRGRPCTDTLVAGL